MDENYEDEEIQQQSLEDTGPTFEYESKHEVQINKLVHSILIESSKSKGLIPDTLTKRVCESVGLECNDDAFFNLMGTLVEMSLDEMVGGIKKLGEATKAKKERMLYTSEVRKAFQQQGIYMCANRVIPEMGISESKKNTFMSVE